jgi:putative MATE family efflux protein
MYPEKLIMPKKAEYMGTQPITRLFLGLALPISMGMLVNGLYNVVDAIFVTRALGPAAMGGVSIVFPIQMFIFALASLISSGMASLVARNLGANQVDSAQKTADLALRLALLTSLVLTIGIVSCMQDILKLMGVSQLLRPYAHDYLLPIILIGIILSMVSAVLYDLLRSEGKAILMMNLMALAALLNIALDAVFIFVLDLGVSGVAYATLISQAASLLMALWFYLSGRTRLQLRLFSYQLDWLCIKQIILLGIPLLISHAGVSIFITLTNYSITQFSNIDSDLTISAYGIIGRMIIFIILPNIAMIIAFQTLCGYNYGAGLHRRVRHILRVSLIASGSYSLLMSLLIMLFPESIIGLFTDHQQLIDAAKDIAYTVFMFFPLANIQALGAAFFQALGKALPALLLSSVRIYFILLPASLILPRWFGINGLWLAFPLADGLGFVIVMIFLYKQYCQLEQR